MMHLMQNFRPYILGLAILLAGYALWIDHTMNFFEMSVILLFGLMLIQNYTKLLSNALLNSATYLLKLAVGGLLLFMQFKKFYYLHSLIMKDLSSLPLHNSLIMLLFLIFPVVLGAFWIAWAMNPSLGKFKK